MTFDVVGYSRFNGFFRVAKMPVRVVYFSGGWVRSTAVHADGALGRGAMQHSAIIGQGRSPKGCSYNDALCCHSLGFKLLAGLFVFVGRGSSLGFAFTFKNLSTSKAKDNVLHVRRVQKA